ncbi:MAG: hypothetical protein WCF95_02685 [bacterium]
MALGVNQTYKNYYTVRLGTLTTNHQIQSNRIMLYTNEVTDIAQRINFFENQRVLTLATPNNDRLAIGAKYFDLPPTFDMNDPETWGTDGPKYTTPCQKQIFVYKKVATGTTGAEVFDGQSYLKIPYTDNNGKHTYETGYSGSPDQQAMMDSRVFSNKLMSGEFTFVYRDDSGVNQKLGYKDLTFITEQQDQTAYQEQVQILEAERSNINNMQKNVQQEMNITETQIQAIQTMMESTEKVLTKNTETFKWGA